MVEKIKNKTWRKVKLGEVLKIRRGASPRPIHEYIRTSGMPWLKIADVTGSGSRFVNLTKEFIKKEGISKSVIVKPGDLILSNSATPGIPRFMKITACVHDGWLILEPSSSLIDKFFLYYRLLIDRQKLISNVTGAIFDNLKTDIIREHEILLPQIDNQKRIADILSAFDDKIELNNKISNNLEQTAQTIFREWFINSEKLKVKSEKLQLKNQKLGELVKIISGHPFSSKLYTKNKKALGVVTIKNVQDGNFVTSCDSFIDEKNVPKNMGQECRLHDGDILLSLTGNVGRVCFVYGGEYLLNQRVAKLKPKNDNDRALCYFLFRQTSIQNQLINMAKGSAQPNLSPIETGEIEFSIPSREALDKFNELVGSFYQQLIKNAVENQKLTALRDLFLPKLMSGEIEI